MKTKLPSPFASRIALGYALIAGLWILVSDRVLETLSPSSGWLTTAQTYKGWGFVLLTAGLLYVLIRHEMVILQQAQAVRDRTVQRLENLHILDREIIESRSIQHVARTAIHHLYQTIPCHHITVGMIDPLADGWLVFSATSADAVPRSAQRLPGPPGGIDDLRAGRIKIVHDAQVEDIPDDPACAHLVADGMRSFLVAPLRVKEQLIGTLGLAARTRSFFTPEYREIIEEVANQLAIALQQVHLAEKLSQHAADLEQNIAKRRQAEQTVRESESRYLHALDTMLEGCQIIGADWRYLYVNDSAARYGRQAKQDLLGHTVMECYPGIEETEMFAALRHCMQERTARLEEFEFTYADGSTAWFRFSIQPVPEGVFILTLDITARKQAAQEIHALNVDLEQRVIERTALLEAKTRELETFTYSVSHDLKAPLRGIDGYSRLLLEDYAEHLDEEGRAFLHNIRHATDQMNQLIEDLLAYSRLERRELHTWQIRLQPIVETLVNESADEARALDATITTSVPDVEVCADPSGLAMALRNLLDNALKFSSSVDGPRIEIGAHETDTACIIRVQDNGVGFDMQYHDRIFEIFQRLHHAEDYAGTGVGLAIVRKAVERMGGRTWAESKIGQGATFYVEIPR